MDTTQVAAQVTELAYALDTFYFLVMGALVMWMAAGFTMLEAGLVRAKNTAEILTKPRAVRGRDLPESDDYRQRPPDIERQRSVRRHCQRR
jgi:hypothetical protein